MVHIIFCRTAGEPTVALHGSRSKATYPISLLLQILRQVEGFHELSVHMLAR